MVSSATSFPPFPYPSSLSPFSPTSALLLFLSILHLSSTYTSLHYLCFRHIFPFPPLLFSLLSIFSPQFSLLPFSPHSLSRSASFLPSPYPFFSPLPPPSTKEWGSGGGGKVETGGEGVDSPAVMVSQIPSRPTSFLAFVSAGRACERQGGRGSEGGGGGGEGKGRVMRREMKREEDKGG